MFDEIMVHYNKSPLFAMKEELINQFCIFDIGVFDSDLLSPQGLYLLKDAVVRI